MADNCPMNFRIYINNGRSISPGDQIKIGRFSNIVWTLYLGWYEYGDNRPVFGLYLIDNSNSHNIRPLQKNDLVDIWIITRGNLEC